MAIVSYIGQDLRIVDANCNGLIEEFEPDRLGPAGAFWDAWPAMPPFCSAAPFDCPYMSALPLLCPFTGPRTFPSGLEHEEEGSADPLSLDAVAMVEVMAGSLEERDEDKST